MSSLSTGFYGRTGLVGVQLEAGPGPILCARSSPKAFPPNGDLLKHRPVSNASFRSRLIQLPFIAPWATLALSKTLEGGKRGRASSRRDRRRPGLVSFSIWTWNWTPGDGGSRGESTRPSPWRKVIPCRIIAGVVTAGPPRLGAFVLPDNMGQGTA